MMGRIGRLLAIAGMLLAVTASDGLRAQEPPTIQVPAGQSIQAAINAAPAGAVIEVAEGTFTETLAISKSLTLKGAGPGKTILDGRLGVPARRPTIRVNNTSKVTITGFTIQDGRRNIEVDNAQEVLVVNNHILRGIRQNVLFNNKASGEIRENEILDAKLEEPGLGRGINVVRSEVKILKNRIARSEAFGIILFASKADIRENVLEDNAISSILVNHIEGEPSNVEIVGNTITGTKPNAEGRFGRGVEVVLSQAVIANNTISKNAQFGIAAFGAGGGEGDPPLEIRENTIDENGLWGVVLFFESDFGIPSKAVLTGNTISSNLGAGIRVDAQTVIQATKNRVVAQKAADSPDRGAGDGFWFSAGSKGTLDENTIENNAGCGVRGTANPDVVVGPTNTIQDNAGGSTCP